LCQADRACSPDLDVHQASIQGGTAVAWILGETSDHRDLFLSLKNASERSRKRRRTTKKLKGKE